MTWPDGASYDGAFNKDLMEGRGVFKWPPADRRGAENVSAGEAVRATYEGDWLQNKRHGNGKMTYPGDNSEYEGDWKDNKRDGKGKLTWKSTPVVQYEGDFKDDQRHGEGT